MATDAQSVVEVCHALYVPPITYSSYQIPSATIQALTDDAQRGLANAVQEAVAAGARSVTSTLLTGPPGPEIVAELERGVFDLCVIATHGRTGMSRILVGSVAEHVIRHSPCSVLATRGEGEVKPFKRLLVPIDFSPSGQHALEVAAALEPDTISLLHVLELPVPYSGEVPLAGFEKDLDRHAAAALESAATKLQSMTRASVRRVSRIGYPGAQTLAALHADPTIDLVVMGSHGRTGLRRVLLGSVAEKVMRHASCSVLVARKRARPA